MDDGIGIVRIKESEESTLLTKFYVEWESPDGEHKQNLELDEEQYIDAVNWVNKTVEFTVFGNTMLNPIAQVVRILK